MVKKCMEANLMVISSVFNFVLAAMFEQKSTNSFWPRFQPKRRMSIKEILILVSCMKVGR